MAQHEPHEIKRSFTVTVVEIMDEAVNLFLI